MKIPERLERFLFGEVAAVRPWLLSRALLVLIAFDTALDLVPHGGRYGAFGFNVAHFRLLDLLQPVPSPELYLTVLFSVSLLALSQALAGPSRVGVAALAVLYTYAWAMSLLDAYQHHYLLSLLLVSVAFFPMQPLVSLFPDEKPKEETPSLIVRQEKRSKKKHRKHKREHTPVPAVRSLAAETEPRTTSAFGYVSFAVTCAIVYLFGALTKLAPEFTSGAALSRLVSPVRVRDAVGDVFGSDAATMQALAWAAIVVELVIAISVIVATTQDRSGRRGRFVPWLGAAPLAFHFGTSLMPLEIGWFAGYMIVIHCVLFAPARALLAVARALDVVRVWTRERLFRADSSSTRFEGLLFAALGLAVIPIFHGIDLPGATVASVLVGAGTAIAGIVHAVRGRPSRSQRLAVACVGAALLLRIAVTHEGIETPSGIAVVEPSDVQHRYYRFVGGDSARRGDRPAARAAYARARAYAPDGATRALMTERLRTLEAPEAGR